MSGSNPKNEILSRLKRIEGQVKGIERMIQEGRQCQDILAQLMAIRRGLDQVGLHLLDEKIEECLKDSNPEVNALALDTLREALKLWTRFG